MASTTRRAARARLELDRSALQQLDAERDVLQTSLDHALATVAALRLDLQSVDTRRDALQAGIRMQSSIFVQHMLASFPTELLRAVFAVLVHQPDELWPVDESGEYNYERAATPFRLAAVCGRWRRMALASPEMWTYIGVPFIGRRNERRAYRYVQMVLDRSQSTRFPSGPQPLHIMLDWHTSSHWSDSDYHQRILDSVGRHSRRWLRVRIGFPQQFLAENANVFHLSTPLLEEFYSDCGDEGVLPWTEASLVYLPDCPRLRRLDDERLFSHPTQDSPTLTYFSTCIPDVSLTVLWEVLRFVPSLQELHVSFGDAPDEVLQPPISPVQLPSLTCLGAYGDDARFLAWLSGLQLPCVTDLWQNGDSLGGFSSAYSALSDKITSVVVLVNCEDDPLEGEAVHALQSLARVRHLVLQAGQHVQGSFFQRARSRELGWSELHSVTLRDVALDGEAALHFVDFVRCRSAESSSPFEVHLVGGTSGPSWLKAEILSVPGAACTIDSMSLQTSASSSDSDGDSDADDLTADETHSPELLN